MFEVNGVYANRKGEYTVLEINPPKMRVRFTEDGSEAELKIELQARIWENIAAEYEARAASRSARAAKRGLSSNASHFIKIISVPAVDEMNFPGWPERVVMAPPADSDVSLQSGDRLIFYALETQTFFAVATITGEPIEANPKEYFFTVPVETAEFYPIDIDAVSSKLDKGADIDSVELESQPRFKRLRLEAEAFYPINEDDFELLAEALTEVAEDEEEEEEEEEDYEEEDE
ncbi:MAG: EVE domain-containing protein [Anaerolineaceae bacterium]|nr:EVE domain-containing protein [Anaerolineaceae bacterium]